MAGSIQDYLFQRIREQLPPDISLAERVAELLFISNDSAYRRIRGETPVVLEEAAKLCAAFGISLDKHMGRDSNSIIFNPVRVGKDYTFLSFLKEIRDNLSRIAADKRAEIIYLTKDLPFFHNFYFQPLFSFRYFFWMKTVVGHPDFEKKAFSFSCTDPDTHAISKEILSLYHQVASAEIWNSESLNSTINQVEYYRDAGFISQADAHKIYEALEQTLLHIQLQAAEAAKFYPSELPSSKKQHFRLFHNRYMMGENTILVQAGSRQTVYLNYELLNYLVTTEKEFCRQVSDNMETLLKRSTLLSEASEKQRNKFFNHLMRKIPKRAKHYLNG